MEISFLIEVLDTIKESNFLWIIIPIFFTGVITDKYQEEFGTSVGNAISNGCLIIFTGFSWLQIITLRTHFPIEATFSQFLFAFLVISYGFSIIASGFKTGYFAQKYGRIRVITFMLIFFTMMIYIPHLYNFFSIILFVFLFPFYYAFITELIKVMPSARSKNNKNNAINERNYIGKKNIITIGKMKLEEYLQ